MLPQAIESTIEDTFNRNTPSIPGQRIANAARPSLIDELKRTLTKPGTSPLVFGYSGVGKTSLLQTVMRQLSRRGPENLNAPFVKEVRIQAAELLTEDPLSTIIQRIRPRSYSNDQPPTYASSVTDVAQTMHDERVAIIVDNVQVLDPAKRGARQIVELVKSLGDYYLDYPSAKIVLVMASSTSATQNWVGVASPHVRPPIDFIEVPPWYDAELEQIVADGAAKCDMQFGREIVREIIALACGIPATVHLIAGLAALRAARSGMRQRSQVLEHDLDFVLAPSSIDALIAKLKPGVPYASALAALSDCQVAAVAFAGRHYRGFSHEAARDFLAAYWPPGEAENVATWLTSAQNEYTEPLDHHGMAHSRELLGNTAALLYLKLQASRRVDGRGSLDSLYRALLSLDHDLERTDMDSTQWAPFVPIIVEATKFLLQETSKWIDRVRREAPEDALTEMDEKELDTPLPVTSFDLDSGESFQALIAAMNDAVAETQAETIKSLVVQIRVHYQNLMNSETKKAKFGIEVPNYVLVEIREESAAVVTKTAQLSALLRKVYQTPSDKG